MALRLAESDQLLATLSPDGGHSVSLHQSVETEPGDSSARIPPDSSLQPETMGTPVITLPLALERAMWRLFREFFDLAEKKRRWNVAEDIPWNECNPALQPVVADIVETFCAVELYLPDYSSKILPKVRHCKSRAWFYANWGYEESKHSLALGDWLRKSGSRSEEYMEDLEGKVFAREWNLPHDDHLAMLAYAMVQEEATFLNYRNLRSRLEALGGDPALDKMLSYLAIDEKAHHRFFRDCLQIYLEYDRPAVLEQLRRVMHNFNMPAINDLLDDSRNRLAAITELDLFSPDIYYREVYLPILNSLGITRQEMRSPFKEKKSLRVG